MISMFAIVRYKLEIWPSDGNTWKINGLATCLQFIQEGILNLMTITSITVEIFHSEQHMLTLWWHQRKHRLIRVIRMQSLRAGMIYTTSHSNSSKFSISISCDLLISTFATLGWLRGYKSYMNNKSTSITVHKHEPKHQALHMTAVTSLLIRHRLCSGRVQRSESATPCAWKPRACGI